MELPLAVRSLERRFGARVALGGVDLELEPGRILGLAGPNGSGKTTLLRILGGLLRPSAGEARVFGLDPFRERAAVMQRAAFAFAPPALFPALSAREHVALLGALGRGAVPAQEVDAALDVVGLRSRADDRVRTYSFGMRQRLALALSIVPRPELLVLDEPTDGLDPLAVLELREVLARLRSEHGVSILLASHLLVEVDELVDELLVLAEGRPLFHGPPAELRAEGARLELRVDRVEDAVRALRAQGHEAEAEADGDGRVRLPAGDMDLDAASACLSAAGVRLRAFHEARPSLEDALLARLRAQREGERP